MSVLHIVYGRRGRFESEMKITSPNFYIRGVPAIEHIQLRYSAAERSQLIEDPKIYMAYLNECDSHQFIERIAPEYS